MDRLFLELFNMSISASWVILAVLLLRLVLKGAPKAIRVLLWGAVGFRLVCPFSLKTALSLIPSAQTLAPEALYDRTPELTTGIPAVNEVVNPSFSESFTADITASVNPLQVALIVAANIWILGMAAMVLYGAVSYLLLRRKVAASLHLRENIWLCDHVPTPFILGWIRPKIYLPSGMPEELYEPVIAHERAHIRSGDHWIKLAGFVLLCVYWFHPLVWLAYILLCRDIELACDERVIKGMDASQKRGYSEALLACGIKTRWIAACPLAFGEVGVKQRIKLVLSYKKPTIWIILIAIVASTVLAVCFLTDPLEPEADTTEPTQSATTMSAQVAISLPSAVAIEENRFYAYDREGTLFLVHWNDTSMLQEGRTVTVRFHSKTELEYPDGIPDGGFAPRYEVTASKIFYETPSDASGPNDLLPPETLPDYADDDYLRKLADEAVKRRYALEDLDDYEIYVYRHAQNTSARVEYELRILGHRTYESYSVWFGSDATIERIDGDYGEYARYLPYATQTAYDQAKKKLDKQLKPYGQGSGYYLTIDQEGYLCLTVEIIRTLQTSETNPDGSPMSGCGLDHEHLFFRERICYYE